jgi:hypothetical protein
MTLLTKYDMADQLASKFDMLAAFKWNVYKKSYSVGEADF